MWHCIALQYRGTLYLQVVSCAAVRAVALDLEGALKGDRDPIAGGHHDMPGTGLRRQVALRVSGAVQHAAFRVQEASTTWIG